jgi:hypothetical protein
MESFDRERNSKSNSWSMPESKKSSNFFGTCSGGFTEIDKNRQLWAENRSSVSWHIKPLLANLAFQRHLSFVEYSRDFRRARPDFYAGD